MTVAIGVTDDNYGYIQTKGLNITSPGNLVLLPAGGELYFSSAKKAIFHEGNLNRLDTSFTCSSLQLNATANPETGIYFRDGYASSAKYNCSILAYDHSGGTADGISINGYDGVSFCTGSNTRQERARITGDGKVGIGTTSPSYLLHVNGTIGANSFVKVNGTSSQFLKADGSVDSTVYFNAGNDGSGSGLDADLLDGNEGSFYRVCGMRNLITIGNYSPNIGGYRWTPGKQLVSGTLNRIGFSNNGGTYSIAPYNSEGPYGYYSISLWYKVTDYVSGSYINVDINDRGCGTIDVSSNKDWTFWSGSCKERTDSARYGFCDFEGTYDATIIISDIVVVRGTNISQTWFPAPEDLVDTYSNQTISGTKTFSNQVSGTITRSTQLVDRYNTGHYIYATYAGTTLDYDTMSHLCGWYSNNEIRALPKNIYSLSSHNHDSVYAKKDGTGASGTWGINISGSASQLGGYGITHFAEAYKTYGYDGSISNGIDSHNYIARGDLGSIGFDNTGLVVDVYQADASGNYPSSPTTTINNSTGDNIKQGTTDRFLFSSTAGRKFRLDIQAAQYIKAVSIYIYTGGKAVNCLCLNRESTISTWGSWHILSYMHQTASSLSVEINTNLQDQVITIYGIRIYQSNPQHYRFPGVANSADYAATAGSASSASSVAWSGVSSKPDTATRWPAWSEVTDKPSTFAPSSHTHDYLPLAGGTINSGGQIICRTNDTNNSSTYNGGIQLREYNGLTTSLEQNAYNAPGITFHWGGWWAGKLYLLSGNLYWAGSLLLHENNWSTYCAAKTHSHSEYASTSHTHSQYLAKNSSSSTSGDVGWGQYTFRQDLIETKYYGSDDGCPVDMQHRPQLRVMRGSDTWSLTFGVKEGLGWIDCVANGIGYGDVYLNPAGEHVIVGNYNGAHNPFSRNNRDEKFIVFGEQYVSNTIESNGFKKTGSSADYVLLGNGGHKAVSDFATSGHTHSYLPLAGGTVTGDVSVSRLNITNTSGVDEITFARGSYNYLRAKTEGGVIGFIANGKSMTGSSVSFAVGGDWISVNNGVAGNGGYNAYVNGSLNATTIYQNGTQVSVNGHTHSYLPLTGGTINGKVWWTNNDANLKIYGIDGGYDCGNETVAIQTSFDGAPQDPETSTYTTSYANRCFLALQPRGGVVGIGLSTSSGNWSTGNEKLIVNGDVVISGELRGVSITNARIDEIIV